MTAAIVVAASHLEAFHLHNESLLIGGEACLWTEYADDENILQRLWCVIPEHVQRIFCQENFQ